MEIAPEEACSKLLTVDLGNSCVKVAVMSHGEPLHIERVAYDDLGRLQEIAVSCGAQGCALSSVRAEDADVREMLLRQFGKNLLVVDNTLEFPLKIRYATPSTLGIDRICAAIGAWVMMPGRDLVVVDAGTAVTVDVVSADGEFLGGDIAPGISLQLKSLHCHTGRLPMVDSRGELPLWGKDTATAIRCGVMRGLAALVASVAASVGGEKRPVVVIDGGDAELLFPLLGDLDLECMRAECLIGIGLAKIYESTLNF